MKLLEKINKTVLDFPISEQEKKDLLIAIKIRAFGLELLEFNKKLDVLNKLIELNAHDVELIGSDYEIPNYEDQNGNNAA